MTPPNHELRMAKAFEGIEKHNREMVRVMEALNNNIVSFAKIFKDAMEPLDEPEPSVDFTKVPEDPNQAVLPIDPELRVKFEVQEFNPELVGDENSFSEPFVYGSHKWAWSNSFKTIAKPLQICIDGNNKRVLLDFNGVTRWLPIEDLMGFDPSDKVTPIVADTERMKQGNEFAERYQNSKEGKIW